MYLIMILLVVLAVVSARVDFRDVPNYEALLKTFEFKVNGLEKTTPLYPPFSAWDMGPYTFLEQLSASDTLEFQVETVKQLPELSVRLNSGPWQSLQDSSFVSLDALGSLSLGLNKLQVRSFYSKNLYYQGWVSQEFEYFYEVHIYKDSGDCVLDSFALSAEGSELTCNQISVMEYDCPTKVSLSTTALEVTFTSSASLTMKHLSFAEVEHPSQVLNSDELTQITSFFQNYLENVLELTLQNNGYSQVYLFRLHKKTLGHLPTGFQLDVELEEPELKLWEFNVKPRAHPQNYNYTLIPVLDEKHNRKVDFYIQTPEDSWAEIRTIETQIPYLVRTLNGAKKLYIDQGWHAWEFTMQDYYKSVEPSGPYYIHVYGLDGEAKIEGVRCYKNPLQSMANTIDYSTNSSDLPLGYFYEYDGYSLGSRELTVAANPPLEELYFEGSGWFKFFTSFSLGSVYLSEQQYGIMCLVEAANEFVTIELSLNDNNFQKHYYESPKTVYPINPGNNTLRIHTVSESIYFTFDYSIEFFAYNYQTDVKSIEFPGQLSQTPEFSNDVSVYRVTVEENTSYISIELETEDQLGSAEVSTDYQVTYSSKVNLLSATVDLPGTEVVHMSVKIIVYAHNQSISRSIWVHISRKDTCGNSRMWDFKEECDDGNQESGDGCYECKIEKGYVCSGGSSDSKSVCVVDTNPQEEPSEESSEETQELQSVCGDGVLALDEECDDGNLKNLDGCSKECLKESNGVICGDGLRVPMEVEDYYEECDDGNNLNGDGCDEFCRIEEGWNCSNSSLLDAQRKPDLCQLVVEEAESESGIDISFAVLGASSSAAAVMALTSLATGSVSRLFGLSAKNGLGSMSAMVLSMVGGFQSLFFMTELAEGELKSALEGFAWSCFGSVSNGSGRILLENNEAIETSDFFKNSLGFLLVLGGVLVAHLIITLLGFVFKRKRILENCYMVFHHFFNFAVYFYLLHLFSSVLVGYTVIQVLDYSEFSTESVVLVSVVLPLVVTAPIIVHIFLKRADLKDPEIKYKFGVLFEDLKLKSKNTQVVCNIDPENNQVKQIQSEEDEKLERSFIVKKKHYKPGCYSSPIRKNHPLHINFENEKFKIEERDQVLLNYTSVLLFQRLYLCLCVLGFGRTWHCIGLNLACYGSVMGLLIWKKPYQKELYNLLHILTNFLFCVIFVFLGISLETSGEWVNWVILSVICLIFLSYVVAFVFEQVFVIIYVCLLRKLNKTKKVPEVKDVSPGLETQSAINTQRNPQKTEKSDFTFIENLN